MSIQWYFNTWNSDPRRPNPRKIPICDSCEKGVPPPKSVLNRIFYSETTGKYHLWWNERDLIWDEQPGNYNTTSIREVK